MSQLSRRELLVSSALLGASGLGGVAADTILFDANDDSGAKVRSPSFPGWRSECSTYYDASKREGEGQSRVFKTNSRLRYLGARWHKYGNPNPESDSNGAWRHTFVLSSVAVRANERGSKPVGTELQRETEITNNFAVASGNKQLRDLLAGNAVKKDVYDTVSDEDGDVPRQDQLAHIPHAQVQGQGYSINGENLALSPYRDDELIAFAKPQPIIKEINDPNTVTERQIFENPSEDRVDDNVAQQAIAARQTREKKKLEFTAVSVVLGIAGLYLAPLSFGSSLLLTVEAVVALGSIAAAVFAPDVPSDRVVPAEVPFNGGFGGRRLSESAPVEAHYVMFDAVVAPGQKEAFYVNPTHRVKNDAKHIIPKKEESNFDETSTRGYNKETAPPTWLIGVEGPSPPPAGDPNEATAEIIGANFEQWGDDPSLGKYWAQSPSAGISGPGILTEAALDEALEKDLPDDGTGDIYRIVEDVPVPSTDAGENTYDASSTVLAGAHINQYTWRFHKIEEEYWNAALNTLLDVSTAPLAYVFAKEDRTDPIPSDEPDQLHTLLNDMAGVMVTDDTISALNDGLRQVVESNQLTFDKKEATSTPTVTVNFGTGGVWMGAVSVKAESNEEEIQTDTTATAINVNRKPPKVGKVDLPTAPVRVLETEQFALTGLDSPKEGVNSEDLEVSWKIAPSESLRQKLREATGDPSFGDLVVFKSRGQKPKVVFNSSGKYDIKAIVSNPNGVSTITTDTVDVDQTLISDIVTPDEDGSFVTGESGQFKVVVGEYQGSAEDLTFTWTFRGPVNKPTQGPEERTPVEDALGKNTLGRSFATGGTYVVEVQAETPSGARALITEEFTVSSGTTGPPAIGENAPPTDPDADGAYEDVTGDGDVDSIDISALNDNLDSEAVQNNPDAFDFDGDGGVDVDDVDALFGELDGEE